ncbi:MAG: hypothetical protein KDA84_13095, partial [Planctomycetaceae bacterium]|nr:hypothetical protein [Planctomycetaceae bacterium]
IVTAVAWGAFLMLSTAPLKAEVPVTYFGTQFGNTGAYNYHNDAEKGVFVKTSTARPNWRQVRSDGVAFEFIEVARTESVIVLHDAGRQMTIILAQNGGYLSTPGTKGLFKQFEVKEDTTVTY